MVIRIGIIGTKEVVEQIGQVIKTFPTFTPQFCIVENETDIPGYAERLSDSVEVILIYGPLAGRRLKAQPKLSIPVHYVPLTEAGLYKALLRAVKDAKLTQGISVDTLTKVLVTRAVKELDLRQLPYVVYNGPPYASAEKLVAFHQEQYEAGRCSIVLTGVQAVAQQLSGLGIPNLWMGPSDQDIIVSLERALLSTESRRNKESQIVVGIINVDDFGKLVMQRMNEHEVQLLKLDIQRMVLSYVESLDGYMSYLGGDEYLFFTTRGIFERETGGYKSIPLAKDAKQSYSLSLSLGIGFGMTANEAGTNAREALRKAKEAGGNSCFIVREDKSIIGPLEMSEPVRATFAPLDVALVKKAEAAGMTSSYLSKLVAYMSKHEKYEYHVHEVAAMLHITVRSAHRLLLMWLDNGLIELSREEKLPKGRPRQMYRFSFIEQKSY
ncbi:hypothetical protein D3P08_22555 [Paenibacillus nanensis]|uniref:GGDEF domain-containing protein n=1 Tax=Paenibacillus nanensis TaxID=393251 RepID=A0A3A1UNH8_9BACL|nr:hypothetical protein [Paenibacillus nanensis]RIX49425.1 hypothetical protein D3P08_22555 [Paenibacillus nanensis]